MRRTHGVGVAFGVIAVAVSMFAGRARAVEAQTVVAVHEEPRHDLVLERDDLRVLDVRIPPGDTTLFHTHDEPIHYVMIGSSRTTSRALGAAWPEVRPGVGGGGSSVGRAFWTLGYAERPVTHQVANIGEGLFRLIAVTNRGDGSAAGADPDVTASEGGGAAPGELEAESPWFERRRLTMAAGEKLDIPVAGSPIVLIQVGPGTARLGTGPGDESPGTTAASGDWLLHEPGSVRELENLGGESVTFVVVRVLP